MEYHQLQSTISDCHPLKESLLTNQYMAWQTVLNVAHVGLSIYQKNGENGYPKSLWLISIFLLLYINNFGATPIFKDAAIWVFPEIRQPEIIGFPIRNNTDLGWSWDPTEDFQRKFSDTNLLQSLGNPFWGQRMAGFGVYHYHPLPHLNNGGLQ